MTGLAQLEQNFMAMTLENAEGARAGHAWAVTVTQKLRKQKYDGLQCSGARASQTSTASSSVAHNTAKPSDTAAVAVSAVGSTAS